MTRGALKRALRRALLTCTPVITRSAGHRLSRRSPPTREVKSMATECARSERAKRREVAKGTDATSGSRAQKAEGDDEE
eukprot:1330754-Rhodomonas_salina.1